jgi:hypothetical protein
MSHRQMISLAAVAALGIACVSTEAFAWRGAVAHHGVVGVRGGTVGYRNGVYGGGYYRPGVGLAAGAVVGGAIAASQYGGYGYGGYGYDYGSGYGYNPGYSVGYTSGGQDAAYCAQRYRSYDPASGTYLGHDGRRHPCP